MKKRGSRRTRAFVQIAKILWPIRGYEFVQCEKRSQQVMQIIAKSFDLNQKRGQKKAHKRNTQKQFM